MCAYAKPRCCSMVPVRRATTEIAARTGITAGLAAIRRQDGEPVCRIPPVRPLTWPDQAVALRARGWPRGGLGTHLRTARTGASQRPNGGCLGRCGTPEPGQRSATRASLCLGRLRFCKQELLHGNHDRLPPQSRYPCLSHLFVPARQVQESGTRSLQAQAAPHPERGNPRPVSLATAGTRFSCRGLTRNSAACYSVLLDNRIQLKSGHEICNASLHIAQQQRFGWLVG